MVNDVNYNILWHFFVTQLTKDFLSQWCNVCYLIKFLFIFYLILFVAGDKVVSYLPQKKTNMYSENNVWFYITI